MVQVEMSQLTGECSTWRDSLRRYREEFTKDKARLQDAASHALSRESLRGVEHLHNQFHIQLINIHDLKQAIKTQERRMMAEMQANQGQLNDETLSLHEDLYDQYQSLEQTLGELRDEFDHFLRRTQ